MYWVKANKSSDEWTGTQFNIPLEWIEMSVTLGLKDKNSIFYVYDSNLPFKLDFEQSFDSLKKCISDYNRLPDIVRQNLSAIENIYGKYSLWHNDYTDYQLYPALSDYELGLYVYEEHYAKHLYPRSELPTT